jgi:hypothetical protein
MAKAHVAARFRRNTAIVMAGILALFTGVSLGSWAPALLPVLVIPALIAVWGWRSGTDASAAGLTIRAAFGSRSVPWSDVAHLEPAQGGRVNARLTSGALIELPAVSVGDIPALIAASGSAIEVEKEAVESQ